MSRYVCPCHKEQGEIEGACPICVEGWSNLPHPMEMTGEERMTEMKRLGILTVPFDMFRQRLEALVGRPVWTHEIGLNWEGLIEEAGNLRPPASMKEIIELVPENKRTVVVL